MAFPGVMISVGCQKSSSITYGCHFFKPFAEHQANKTGGDDGFAAGIDEGPQRRYDFRITGRGRCKKDRGLINRKIRHRLKGDTSHAEIIFKVVLTLGMMRQINRKSDTS